MFVLLLSMINPSFFANHIVLLYDTQLMEARQICLLRAKKLHAEFLLAQRCKSAYNKEGQRKFNFARCLR